MSINHYLLQGKKARDQTVTIFDMSTETDNFLSSCLIGYIKNIITSFVILSKFLTYLLAVWWSSLLGLASAETRNKNKLMIYVFGERIFVPKFLNSENILYVVTSFAVIWSDYPHAVRKNCQLRILNISISLHVVRIRAVIRALWV
jgi:hypothetical protein